jgi:hypothetical protein
MIGSRGDVVKYEEEIVAALMVLAVLAYVVYTVVLPW